MAKLDQKDSLLTPNAKQWIVWQKSTISAIAHHQNEMKLYRQHYKCDLSRHVTTCLSRSYTHVEKIKVGWDGPKCPYVRIIS